MKTYIKPEVKVQEMEVQEIISSSGNPSGYWEDTHHNDPDPNPYWHGGWGQPNPGPNPDTGYRDNLWGGR